MALLIFGLVLFPSQEDFLDLATLNVFLVVKVKYKDPTPALLADVHYTLYLRHLNEGGIKL